MQIDEVKRAGNASATHQYSCTIRILHIVHKTKFHKCALDIIHDITISKNLPFEIPPKSGIKYLGDFDTLIWVSDAYNI